MKDSPELLRINDVAAITQLSADTIRFYEKKGVIEPARFENNYRCYTYNDVRILADCKVYRTLGFSVDEIKFLVNTASRSEANKLFDAKTLQLEQQVMKTQLELQMLRDMREVDTKYRHFRQGYFVRESNEDVFYCYKRDGIHNEDVIHSRGYAQMLEFHSISKGTMLISRDKLDSDDQSHPTSGFSMPRELAKQHGISDLPPAVIIPPQVCVFTVVTSTSMLSYEDLEESLNWMRQHNFELTGDIIVKVLAFSFERGVEHRTYEVWLPC